MANNDVLLRYSSLVALDAQAELDNTANVKLEEELESVKLCFLAFSSILSLFSMPRIAQHAKLLFDEAYAQRDTNSEDAYIRFARSMLLCQAIMSTPKYEEFQLSDVSRALSS